MNEPIKFFRENECPKCNKLLQLVDIDISINAIDSDGRILSGIKDNKTCNRFFLYCSGCKTKYTAEKVGQFVRIKRKHLPLNIANPLYSDSL